MRSIDRRFYMSPQWEAVRSRYLKKVNHLCERCLAKGVHEPAAVVHHKIHLTEENYRDPEIALCFDNLEALCLACHNEEHNADRRKKFEKRWRFIDGELVTGEPPSKIL